MQAYGAPHHGPSAPFGAPPPPKKGIPTGLIVLFVVLGVFAVLVPVFAVLAIYGVRKYIAHAKTAEARNSIAQIAKDAVAAYESQTGTARTGPAARTLCASASRPVPESARYIRGAKYQSAAGDWSIDAPRNAGFACLKFSLDQPQYYMYSYSASARSSGRDSFEAKANGDLNGDGVLSTFSLTGHIQPGGAIEVDPNLVETNPEE
jgi:type IV pilus assembly protein PilA